MKAAIILTMPHESMAQQASEINRVLQTMTPGFKRLEMWLFYRGTPPESFPEIDCPVSVVKLITLPDKARPDQALPESYLQLLEQLTDRYPMDLLLFAGDSLGRELATRLAFRLKGSSSLQVQSCHPTSGKIKIIKPVYGNNLRGTFILNHPPFCLSMARQPCCPAKRIPYAHHLKEIITLNQPQCPWVEETFSTPDKFDNKLGDADRVMVVGQGAGNKETVDRLKGIADSIGAAFGASRPVVMNAWADMERLIGASGLILSPKLCIAAGVSGSAVFSAGIKASEFIVAVNTDKTAPVFHIAHVGIIGEMTPVLLELEKIILTERERTPSIKNKKPGLTGDGI